MSRRNVFLGVAVVVVGLVALTAALSGAVHTSAQTPAPGANGSQFETMLAGRFGVSVQTLRQMESAAQAAAADRLSSRGLISPQQASVIRGTSASPLLERGFGSLASATGASEQQLFDRLANGESLAQIAASNGIDAATLKANLTAAARDLSGQAQGLNLVQPSQAAQLDSLLTANLDRLINLSLPRHQDSGSGR